MQLIEQNPPAVKNHPVQHECFHCHEDCADERLHLDDKYFCCNGCLMVYEILNTHELCEFYTLDQQAGRSLKKQRNARSYAYLNDPEIQENLLDFNQDSLAQIVFYLPQMHCVSCVWLLEQLSRLDAGVIRSRVNFLKKTVTIQYNPGVTQLSNIAALLASIGYEPEINLGDTDNAKRTVIGNKLASQIAVAGFAFGNIMLFSFPEYVGMDAETFRWFANIFGYLSIALSLPVLLFSARDYFVSAWQGIKNRQLNISIPLCLALASLFLRSIWEILTHSGAGYLDSFAGLTFLLLIGKWFQQHTWNQLSFERNYKSYFPIAATLKTRDSETFVPVNRLVPGDIILVKSQEIIPADGILLKGDALIDYSFVTGEANPIWVKQGERVFAGGRQTGPAIEITLTKRVSQSHLTDLWNNEAFNTPAAATDSVSNLADQAGRFFSWLILAVGGGAFLWWWLVQSDIRTAINAFTAVMIVACPCTLALSIPFTLGNILRILGRHHFYLKNNRVVESLATTDTVVFDKTGTITYASQQPLQFHGTPLDSQTKQLVKSLVHHSTHPHSRHISALLSNIPVLPVSHFEEIPGLGIRGTVAEKSLAIGSAKFVGAETPENSGVYIALDGTILGWYEIKSHFREGLGPVLAFFGQEQQRLAPLPQNKPTAAAAKKSKIFLISGDQNREATALSPYFPNPDNMLFDQSPYNKLDFVKKLQDQGNTVLMIGDGLNDAGALRQSDAGIVITENTNNFTPACDAILHADAFTKLPQFVQLARSGVRIVKKSYAIALLYNAIGLSYAVSGTLSPLVAAILMPVSSVSIVLFGIGMGNWAARRLHIK